MLKSRGADDAGTDVGADAGADEGAAADAGAAASAAMRSCTLQRGSGEPTGMLSFGSTWQRRAVCFAVCFRGTSAARRYICMHMHIHMTCHMCM